MSHTVSPVAVPPLHSIHVRAALDRSWFPCRCAARRSLRTDRNPWERLPLPDPPAVQVGYYGRRSRLVSGTTACEPCPSALTGRSATHACPPGRSTGDDRRCPPHRHLWRCFDARTRHRRASDPARIRGRKPIPWALARSCWFAVRTAGPSRSGSLAP